MSKNRKRKVSKIDSNHSSAVGNDARAAFLDLPQEWRVTVDNFIFNLNDDKSPIEEHVQKLGHLFTKDKFAHLGEIVSYLNEVSERGAPGNERITRFGHLFQNSDLCEKWLAVMDMARKGRQKDNSFNHIHALFKNCLLNVDGQRLIDIVSSHGYRPEDYYAPQNAMMLKSIDPEMVSKIREWVLSENHKNSLNKNCLKSVEAHWAEKIAGMPGAADFMEARATLCKKASTSMQFIGSSMSKENNKKVLESLATEMVDTRYSPNLEPHLNIYTGIYLDSWVFELQDLSTEDKMNFISVAAKHPQYDSDLYSFLINAMSKQIWSDEGAYLSYDNLSSIAVTYPALKEASAIIEANMALKEKELLSHQLFSMELSSSKTSNNKI